MGAREVKSERKGRFESKCEELNVSKSSPLSPRNAPSKRTSLGIHPFQQAGAGGRPDLSRVVAASTSRLVTRFSLWPFTRLTCPWSMSPTGPQAKSGYVRFPAAVGSIADI